MRVATCHYAGKQRIAIEDGDMLGLLPEGSPSLRVLLGQDPCLRSIGAPVERVGIDAVRFLCPVPHPGKIVCVGLNYRGHGAEAGVAPPAWPSLFTRFHDSQVGHLQPIVAPSNSAQFDYEGELAVIIGAPAWHVPEADAMRHVAGYSCFAENSVRDFQAHSRQVTPGKNFLGSGAFGPWLTTADTIADVAQLQITVRINAAIVQHDTIASLIFPIPALIAYISSFTRLEPGDVIVTGTPQGVGFTRNPPLWLKPDDMLSVSIPGVGEIRNPIVAAPAFPQSKSLAESMEQAL